MLKSIAKNSVIYYVSTILTKGISFFLLPLYTSLLSPGNYGVIELMSIISTIVIIVFSLQINQAVARYYNELESQKQMQEYTSTVAIFSLISFGLFTVGAFIFLPQISAYVNLKESEAAFAIVSVSLNALFYLSQNQLSWKIKPVQEMISSLVYNFFTIGFTIYFLVVAREGVVGIFKAQSIGAFAGILIAVANTKSDFGFYFSKEVLKKLLFFSMPLVPGALAIFVYMLTDRICIKEMLGMDELGVYSVGNKIASILSFAGIGISSALSPLIFKHYKEVETPDKIALLYRIFATFSFILLAFLSFFAEPIIRVMTNEQYLSAVPIIPFLLYAVFLNSLTLFFHGLLFANKTAKISVIAISAGVLNLVLNIIFIPEFGILAAAAATLVSYGLNFILLFKFSQKEYPIKVTLIPLAVVTIIFFSALFLMYYFEWREIGIGIVFILCSGIAALLIMKKRDYLYLKQKLQTLNGKRKGRND
jgi:O-antigen/teichoic acid export membrane protein